MKKILLYTVISLLFTTCSTSRQMEKAVSAGNYDQAISDAIRKLRVNKDKRGKSDIIIILKEAFNKATQRDLSNITFLKKDNNPENYIRIYDAYVDLNNRQERIKPLLPLYVKGREVKLNFKNYTNEIVKFKVNASKHIYTKANNLINSNDKLNARLAYKELEIIEDINPNYKDVRRLMDLAHDKGTDFVLVDMINDSGKIIPARLERDLLNFSSYGLKNFWAVYHSKPDSRIKYDYKVHVNLRDINISPEQIKERQIIKEKQIVDGKIDLVENGRVVKDSIGNTIKVDNLKTVRCEYYEFTQFKSTQINGSVEYINLNTNQLVDAFPITSEFVFEHIYANSRGDRRALESALISFLNRRAVPFPTEEQMIYDTGEDLKLKLKHIINSYNFQNNR